MEKFMKKILICIMVATLLFTYVDVTFNTSILTISAEAHSGRTDSSGGHKDNKNKSGLGSYHYHCGGNPAHLHKNGVCPYDTSSINTTTKSSSKSKASTTLIKSVQKELNELGYDCGTADGFMGKKTKKVLKQYQEDYGLTVDGIIGKEVKDSLGIY